MIKHEYNLQTFYNEDEISYYLLGAFMADGCVYEVKNSKKLTTSISSKDLDWLTEINNYICPKRKLLKKGLNCHEAMYNCTPLGKWLISKGCVPKKSKIMDFADIPEKFLKDFIRGCWDGDGSVTFNKNANRGKSFQTQIYLTSGSILFCNKMKDALLTLGITSKVVCHNAVERSIDGRILKPSYNWRIKIWRREDCYNFCKLIYRDDSKIYLNRKKIIANKIIDFINDNNCIDCSVYLGKIKTNSVRCNECRKKFNKLKK